MAHYSAFDATVASSLHLPELPETEVRPAELTVTAVPGPTPGTLAIDPCYQWADEAGATYCSVGRADGQVHYAWHGLATFVIRNLSDITCYREPDCSEALQRHFLVNQVVPRTLAARGRTILHASSVQLDTGGVVVFVGESGHGKSTLAASFARHGATLLSDDCLQVFHSNGRLMARGLFPGLRLKAADSTRTPPGFHVPRDDRQLRKQQWLEAGPDGHGPARMGPVAALFALNDPSHQPATDIGVEKASGPQAFMDCIRHQFRLDPSDEATTVSDFHKATAVLSNPVPVFNLRYPRIQERLAAVRQAIIDAVSQ